MNTNIFSALALEEDESDEVVDLAKLMAAFETRKESKVDPAPKVKSLDDFEIAGIINDLGSRSSAEKASTLTRPLVWIDLEMTGIAFSTVDIVKLIMNLGKNPSSRRNWDRGETNFPHIVVTLPLIIDTKYSTGLHIR